MKNRKTVTSVMSINPMRTPGGKFWIISIIEEAKFGNVGQAG